MEEVHHGNNKTVKDDVVLETIHIKTIITINRTD